MGPKISASELTMLVIVLGVTATATMAAPDSAYYNCAEDMKNVLNEVRGLYYSNKLVFTRGRLRGVQEAGRKYKDSDCFLLNAKVTSEGEEVEGLGMRLDGRCTNFMRSAGAEFDFLVTNCQKYGPGDIPKKILMSHAKLADFLRKLGPMCY